MRNKLIRAGFLLVCLIVFAGCKADSKTLYQSGSVEVVSVGNRTVISDLVADKKYYFRSVRVKRTESEQRAYTSTDTDTINIEIMPSGFRIYDKTADKIIYISAKKFTQ